MGRITQFFNFFFGGRRNVIAETAEVFIPNAENSAQRAADVRQQAMAQYAHEFGQPGLVNRIADGMNRMGRPLITYGVIGLFISAMYDPLWFAARMQGLALVPEPLWIIFGAIVSFFFGARELSKYRGTSMAKEAARIAAAVPQVVENIKALTALSPGVAKSDGDLPDSGNQAVEDWKRDG